MKPILYSSLMALFAVLILTGCECRNPVDPRNSRPVIVSLAAKPDTVNLGAASKLVCLASDPDNDALTFLWTARQGSIQGSGDSVTWVAPNNEGHFHVTCQIFDGKGGQARDSVGIAVLMPSSLLWEDFEGNQLDPRIRVNLVGSYNSAPGIKTNTIFGSTNAFGFGLSNCSASCFGAHVTQLAIFFEKPSFIKSISFKEIELMGNWGSKGKVYIDGQELTKDYQDFGRLPMNDGKSDSAYRTREYSVGRMVSIINLEVWDITRSSEIFIDDLVIK